MRQAPRTVPLEAVNILRQAPLGGPLLFGEDAVTQALAMKDKDEQSTVNRQFIKQATSQDRGRRKVQPKTKSSSGRRESSRTVSTPYRSTAKGRGGSTEPNPFVAGRPTEYSRSRPGQQRGGGQGRGRGGGGGQWKKGKKK